ncbi:MAG: 1-acyl-sn-glycerol-3-phosphate acyltransferase [Tenericutes bacterium]|nr:1-acyl-sn-glycerol-3-phosphate acyltransferase [Mycoplasmatota bacterium]
MRIDRDIYSLVVKAIFRSRFNIEVQYNDFDPKRTDAYVLLGNHPCLHDGIYTSTYLKEPPMPVISATMFVNPIMRFALTVLYPSISKRKGQNDIITVRKMMQVTKSGKGVMLFPEGNSSYYGKESPIPYSTVKLLKKLKKDVVIVKTNGAYLSAARWGSKTVKNGLIELIFTTLYKAEELASLSLDEIYNGLSEALKFNDYDWNRERLYKYNPKKRALGLERFIYYCPKCGKHQTISTKGNKVFCKHCGEIAHFNEYCFLEGLDFDNLVDWGKLQQSVLPEISKKAIYTYGTLYKIDTVKYKSKKLGDVDVELINDKLYLLYKTNEYCFDLDKMVGLALTFKEEISFDYEEETYFIKLKDPMLLYEMIKYKTGGLH